MDRKCVRNLASSILLRAIKDFANPKRRDEVREFFKSEWGKTVCEMVDVSSKRILCGLEDGTIKFNEQLYRALVIDAQ